MKQSFHPMARETAETIGLNAIGFLASEPARLAAFLSGSGMTLDVLHTQAGEPHVMAAPLEALLQNEPELLTFAAHSRHTVADITRAQATLDPSARAERSI